MSDLESAPTSGGKRRRSKAKSTAATTKAKGGGDAGGGANGSIIRGDLAEEARRKYLNYALSVITSRAIPDVRDGLKPVQRRILYTMFADLGLTHEARHRKSAKVVGDVIGKYHPHGDTAVYDAMVRLAQDFNMRVPLVDGQGNFGSIDGDSPAAYRYTEAKLTAVASELLKELRKETVDYRPTYDGTSKEPIVLPARFPQLLVNGGTGIAVGMATSIPPHNLSEVARACVALIDKPDASVRSVMRHVRGPDFPTGGQLVATRDELVKIYETGRGSCKLQGNWKVEEDKGATKIVIYEVPHGIEKSALVEEIGNIVLAKKVPGLVDVQDLSTRDVRVELELKGKNRTEPDLVMAYLLKHTRLQVTVKFDLTVLVPTANPEVGAPARLGLVDILRHFLAFRLETVRRRFEYELRKLLERIHILEGFEIIFDNLDAAIRLIRRSEGKADAASKLQKKFSLSEIQAEAILETKLYRLAKLEILKIREELEAKRKEAKRIQAILKSEAKLWGVVKEELEEVAKEFGNPRRTKISDEDVTEEFSAEAFIPDEDAYVLLTRDGWLKRQRSMNLATTRMRDGDAPLAVVAGSTKESVVVFTTLGSAYNLRINDVPASTGHGSPIQQLFKFKDGERPIAAVGTDPRVMQEFAFPKPELGEEYEDPYPHMLAVTKGGMALRFTLWPHKDISTTRGRMFGRLKKGDEFVAVFKVYADEPICVVTAQGRVLCCEAQEVNLLAGPGKGVTLIKLGAGDEVLSAFTADRDVSIEKSTGATQKLTAANRAITARGGKGQALLKRGAIKGVVGPELVVPDLATVEGENN
ncbi:MAG: DNA topoisomerase IV subunit A [Nannocystaceae bacterium]